MRGYRAPDYTRRPTPPGVITPTSSYSDSAFAPAVLSVTGARYAGLELAGAESTANATFAQGVAWADVAGIIMTVPAGSPWNLEVFGQTASVQGSAATGSVARLQFRVVDSLTSTTLYAYAEANFVFPGTGATIWQPVMFRRRQSALGTATSVKLQAQVASLTGLGNTGLFPASAGSAPPTTMQAISR